MQLLCGSHNLSNEDKNCFSVCGCCITKQLSIFFFNKISVFVLQAHASSNRFSTPLKSIFFSFNVSTLCTPLRCSSL
ncbi:hypothetical protein Scep_017473 [Stephania cephalantha]|uniref:Uncharacterized protein n=1 Tax=Stephania cephalantha TaxID=152367 RepID=A0AAP0NVP9_9MAGN